MSQHVLCHVTACAHMSHVRHHSMWCRTLMYDEQEVVRRLVRSRQGPACDTEVQVLGDPEEPSEQLFRTASPS